MRLQYFSCLVILLVLLPSAKGEDAPWSFSGPIVNTTNPKHAIEGTATLSFKAKECAIRVNAPLIGAGTCSISQFDQDKGTLTVKTEGPAGNITFTGTVSGNLYSGTYIVDYPNYREISQKGTFQFRQDATPVVFDFGDVIQVMSFNKNGQHYNVLREREIAYIYDKDFNYFGIRIILDAKDNPIVRVEDHQDGAEYIDLSSNKVLYRWHCDGTNGYFEKPLDGYSELYDRFMEPTNWSTIESSGERYYLYTRDKELELYDKHFQYLNIHSSTTQAGKVVWLKDDKDGFTEYFDADFKPLNWYSTRRDGQLYYAHIVGKKVTVYDADLHEIKKQHPYWRAFGRGMVAGLAAYGQALQTQAVQAQSNQSYASTSANGYSTTYAGPVTYNTTSQQIGNFTYSNTTGSDGYTSQQTRQQIGNFGYINGTSSLGGTSGSTQQIGNFTYGNYTTPSGQWQSSSQQIGDIEYHTITAPDGSMHTGTSQRIGDFVYTNIQ